MIFVGSTITPAEPASFRCLFRISTPAGWVGGGGGASDDRWLLRQPGVGYLHLAAITPNEQQSTEAADIQLTECRSMKRGKAIVMGAGGVGDMNACKAGPLSSWPWRKYRFCFCF